MSAAESWQSRIVGYGEESVNTLRGNPANWRVHPTAQQEALAGVIERIGWVRPVIVNKTTGFMLDGHARLALAIQEEQATIPVCYVELTPEEEALVLATFDPLSWQAATDREKLNELMASVPAVDSTALQRLLAEMSTLPASRLVRSTDGQDDDDDAGPAPEGQMVRQIVLRYEEEDYLLVVDGLARAMAEFGVDNNTDALIHLVDKYEVEHAAATG